jgi:hypothetical protein
VWRKIVVIKVNDDSAITKLLRLDAERAQLVADAKSEALAAANAAIADLNSLGFSYRLVEGTLSTHATTTPGGRRAGIREQVLGAIKASGAEGATRADLINSFGMSGDTSGQQSVSNALSALKKSGATAQRNGRYITV